MATEKSLHILYFAAFRESAGTGEEHVRSFAMTAADLYGEISRRHGIPYDISILRVALNDEVVPWSAPVRDGDTVVFLAPFAGG